MEIIVVETGALDFTMVESYLSCVSAGRRSVVMKKKTDSDKVQSLIAGLLLRSQISRFAGIPIKKISFVKGAHGKPYLNGGGVQFSVSHTNGAVCIALTDDSEEIGVDIERKDRRVSERLRERVLSGNERLQVRSNEDFICVWVKKEAFLKRTGIGVATDLKGADTTILPDTIEYLFGEYIVGVSGKGAAAAKITALSADELLSRFTPKKK